MLLSGSPIVAKASLVTRNHTKKTINGTCGLSVTTFFHQVLNYYYLTVYIMFKPKMSLEGSVH